MIVGGGTAGWLTAAYLARYLQLSGAGRVQITLIESREIGIIGVGEGTFPTIRETLRFLGIEEQHFIRHAQATFKQGIRFTDWVHAPDAGKQRHFFHPFEPPFYADGANLVPYWLLQDAATRPPFAEAVTIQNRVAAAARAPKRPHEGDFDGPLNYAYHFDAASLASLLSERAQSLGVERLEGTTREIVLTESGAIARILTDEHGALEADLYIDCTGLRAELIGKALSSPFKSVRKHLFANAAVTCKIPLSERNAPLESVTIATAHEAGWIWDIALPQARGVGCVYSSDYISADRAEAILHAHVGEDQAPSTRHIAFEAGYRERHWIKNCVAVGLSGGFLEPLESTGVLMIEAAVGMIADLFPHNGPIDGPARRFNELIAARYDNIVNFLKLHYCLSQRPEPFWRDNADPMSIPQRLQDLLEDWRYRPPSRFDFTLDVESFSFFNYQYILYGMGFETDLASGSDYPDMAGAEKLFARIRNFGERAMLDLPSHRALIAQINQAG